MTRVWMWNGVYGIEGGALPSYIIINDCPRSLCRRTHHGLEDLANGPGDSEVSPDEHWIGSTLHVGEHACSEISSRADHVVESHEESGPLQSNQLIFVLDSGQRS
jgi:hypothetical protein